MPVVKTNDLSEQTHTDDVIVHDDINFKDLLLSKRTLKGLESSGYIKPSPIQRRAIPLGRCGFDLIVQAKSGTGKTCVFTVIALEMINLDLDKLQVLIVSPTREISVQIKEVITDIAKTFKNLKVQAFIGGLPLELDKKRLHKCQIAVGAPGRIKHLISEGFMKLDAVRLFILDEADKLMEETFRNDINFIFLKLPDVKQTIAASATFPPSLENFVTDYMVNPIRVCPGNDTFLIGIRQFVSLVPCHSSSLVQVNNKMSELLKILSSVSFKQCMVFSNYQSRAESICNKLNKAGWPSVFINGSQSQTVRLQAMSSLKEFKCRILLSTDLSARGIDAENVNLVINLDVPYDGATYLHRIGRAGRYGTHGLAITIVESGHELEEFRKMLYGIGGLDFQILLIPEESVRLDLWKADIESFKKISTLEGEYTYSKIKEHRETKKKNEFSTEDFIPRLTDKYSKVPENPSLTSYDNLVEFASDYEKNHVKQVQANQPPLNYGLFITKLLFRAVTNERNSWYKFREKSGKREGEIENEVPKILEADVEVKPKTETSSEETEDEVKTEEEEEESVSDISSSDSESESEITYDDSFPHLKNWYSMWYSQLSMVKQYVNYLKYYYYFNEMIKKS